MIVRFIQQYFNYTKKEALGFFILSTIMLIVMAAPFFVSFFVPVQTSVSKEDIKLLDSLMTKIEEHEQYRLFEFNPNELKKDSLLLLGLSPAVSENILKYRKAGGTFKIKSDLRKIYGFKKAKFSELEPYIDLPESIEQKKEVYAEDSPTPTDKPEEKQEQVHHIDLNTAEANDLQRINGIGKVYSERIVKYRYILGGFVNKAQLKEVYGISQFALDNLMKYGEIGDDFNIKKLDINKLDAYKLKYHPYVTEKMASAIVDAREEGVSLKSRHDLEEIINIKDSTLAKLLPYIEF